MAQTFKADPGLAGRQKGGVRTVGADYLEHYPGRVVIFDWRDAGFFDFDPYFDEMGNFVIKEDGREYPVEELLAKRLDLETPLETKNGYRWDWRRRNIKGAKAC